MTADDATRRSVAILAFHKIGEPPRGTWTTWNYVPTDVFSGFLNRIRDEGFQVLDLPTFLKGMQNPESLPLRSALITFDDGYASMLHEAEPVLSRFGYPSVLFVPTGYIGGINRFDAGNEPEEMICNREELRELQNRGVSIQSHAVTHRSFSSLSDEDLETELRDSKTVLEEHLNTTVDVIAFPFGDGGSDPDRTDAALECAGYKAACLYKGGLSELNTTNRFRLPRLAMGPDSKLGKMLGTA